MIEAKDHVLISVQLPVNPPGTDAPHDEGNTTVIDDVENYYLETILENEIINDEVINESKEVRTHLKRC